MRAWQISTLLGKIKIVEKLQGVRSRKIFHGFGVQNRQDVPELSKRHVFYSGGL